MCYIGKKCRKINRFYENIKIFIIQRIVPEMNIDHTISDITIMVLFD